MLITKYWGWITTPAEARLMRSTEKNNYFIGSMCSIGEKKKNLVSDKNICKCQEKQCLALIIFREQKRSLKESMYSYQAFVLGEDATA